MQKKKTVPLFLTGALLNEYTQEKKVPKQYPYRYMGTILVPFVVRGTLSTFFVRKKYPSVGGVPKQYPSGHQIMDRQIVPIGALFRYPFFLVNLKPLVTGSLLL